jgi:hypothetical protein
MSKRKILLQLDPDPHPSVFDRVVAVDAGVDEIFSYGGVTPHHVEALVHGAMFTRGVADLKSTAIFVGGQNTARAEELLAAVRKVFFGPVRNSVMLDPNGANTTAAATVLCAMKHLDLAHTTALVLGGTGPVGQRIALLLAKAGAGVWVASRSGGRASDACDSIKEVVEGAKVHPLPNQDADAILKHADRYHLVVAAGAAGVRFFDRSELRRFPELKVAIDVNAVPPTGLEGVEPGDKGEERHGVFHYGAMGVGGIKMKVHRAAVSHLFDRNDQVFDAVEIFDLAVRLAGG